MSGTRLYWFWPEREGLRVMLEDQGAWLSYRRAADAAGLTLDLITVDDVQVLATPTGSQVFVRRVPVAPDESMFHTKLYTWPQFAPDVWRSLSTYQAIAEAGYCTLIRPELNLISNDKAATLLHLGDLDPHWLPTLTAPTRDTAGLSLQLAAMGIEYPVVVKPAGWGSGRGVLRADHESQLRSILSLASAGELTMVIQPYLAAGDLADVRVYCADRRPVGALRRTPTTRSGIANVAQGGQAELIPVPGELAERARAIATRLDAPWLGVDFLRAGGRYHLSEVEVDAFVSPASSRLPGMSEVLRQRFAAYRADFTRWCEGYLTGSFVPAATPSRPAAISQAAAEAGTFVPTVRNEVAATT